MALGPDPKKSSANKPAEEAEHAVENSYNMIL